MRYVLFIIVLLLCGRVGVVPAGNQMPKKVDTEVASLVRGNNEFAIELYKQVAKQEGNSFFAPQSISTALAQVYAGARGETASQMAKTLRLTLDQDHLHPTFDRLQRNILQGLGGDGSLFEMANACWVQKSLPIKPDFARKLKAYYRSDLHQVDFAGSPEAARATINKWVFENTKEKIKDILQRQDVDAVTALYLTNTVYFEGFWENPFPRNATKDDFFYDAPLKNFRTPFMHIKKMNAAFATGQDFTLLELPYRGKRASMFILLPKKRCGLPEVEKTLTFSTIEKLLAQRVDAKWDSIVIPKFSIKSEFRLRETLGTMGMKLCFSESADFSGITWERIQLHEVLHNSWIQVDEDGTVAAAATAVGARPLSYSPPKVFKADHPFLFFVRDSSSGAILFVGRVSDPRKNSGG
jgi:serpin B